MESLASICFLFLFAYLFIFVLASLISVFSKTLAFQTASAFLGKEVVWDNECPFQVGM